MGVRILPHRVEHVRLTSFNSREIGAMVDRGMIPEVLDWVARQPLERREEPKILESFGRALVAARKYDEARKVSMRARAGFGVGSVHSGALAWADAQAAFQQGNVRAARSSAREAKEFGFPVPEGWLVYLDSLAERGRNLNRIEGHGARLFFRYGRPRLPRIGVEVNDQPAEAVVDTGAALTLVTERAAARWGIVPIAGSDAEGSGLHGTRFPVRFGTIDRLEIGGLVVHDVPVGVIPDSALEFESTAGATHYDLLLGCHLWKEFRLTLDYRDRLLLLVPNTGPPTAADSAVANLFVIEGKPTLRGSINGVGWFRFLVDTGSEFTLVHRAGSRRYGNALSQSPIEPITVHGIGKSRSQWGKISEITLGVDAWQVFFEDVLMTDDSETADDAIVGSSFLDAFVVILDFGHLQATLIRLPEVHELELTPGSPLRRAD